VFENFKKIGRKLFEKDLVGEEIGCLSIRKGDKIFITKEKSNFEELTSEDIWELDINENSERVFPEARIHQAIYKNCKVSAIIHAYPAYSIAISFSEGKVIPMDNEGIQNLKSIPVARLRDSDREGEVMKTLSSIFNSGYKATLLKGRGVCVVAENLEMAYRLVRSAEKSCKILYLNKTYHSTKSFKKEGRDFRREGRGERRSAIPPSIGVMGRKYRTR
jgi:L-fuculose-phosphate aldolase